MFEWGFRVCQQLDISPRQLFGTSGDMCSNIVKFQQHEQQLLASLEPATELEMGIVHIGQTVFAGPESLGLRVVSGRLSRVVVGGKTWIRVPNVREEFFRQPALVFQHDKDILAIFYICEKMIDVHIYAQVNLESGSVDQYEEKCMYWEY